MDSASTATNVEPGRALKPGPVRAAAALLIAITPSPAAAAGAGGSKYPSYLPKSTLNPHVDAVLTGTIAKPALTVEGLPVEIKTKAFDVRMTVAGPVVPGEGLPYQQDATVSTWTVTMKNATADVPVSLADFHAVDHLYTVTVPVLAPGPATPSHGAPSGPGPHLPPPRLHAGRRRDDAVEPRSPARGCDLGLHRRERLTAGTALS